MNKTKQKLNGKKSKTESEKIERNKVILMNQSQKNGMTLERNHLILLRNNMLSVLTPLGKIDSSLMNKEDLPWKLYSTSKISGRKLSTRISQEIETEN